MSRNLRFSAVTAIVLLLLCCSSLQICAQTRRPEDSEAATALFARSDLTAGSRLAQQALQRNPFDRNALFVEMEIAALRADEFTELKSAIDLVSSPGSAADPRIQA